MENSRFQLSPLGYMNVSQEGCSLHIDKPFLAGLKGIEGFSHLMVLWWSHLCDNETSRRELTCEQPYKKAPEAMGVFATRSPVRPNPILLTPVMVLDVDEKNGVISIPFIDAEDKSPILDIKPYHPSLDRIKEVRVPSWCQHWPQWYEDSASFDWESEFVNAS